MGGENAQHRFSPGLETQLIPAHAGKTVAVQSTAPPCAAHPRSRGENSVWDKMVERVSGSSPLTRGKHGELVSLFENNRLIPAHAGKTSQVGGHVTRRSAHPRSRGENLRLADRTPRLTGSSPLTRGKRGPRRRAWTRGMAHPRSRGENDRELLRAHPVRGSSPLTRGKLDCGRCDRHGFRLIPAHAGKTLPAASASCAYPAHPRSRGENVTGGLCELRISGSSPLTRGKHGSRWPRGGGSGLIPAHAGKTHAALVEEPGRPAHPRSRGENIMARPDDDAGIGSSPLTRGKPLRVLV